MLFHTYNDLKQSIVNISMLFMLRPSRSVFYNYLGMFGGKNLKVYRVLALPVEATEWIG